MLAAASLREMHKPRYLADDDWTERMGHFLVRGSPGRRDLDPALGRDSRVHHRVCFDPAAQVGAVVLHNGASGTAEVAMELAVTLAVWPGTRMPAIALPAPTPESYRPLLGIYARPGLGGWVLGLEWRAGELAFLIPGDSLLAADTGADQ